MHLQEEDEVSDEAQSVAPEDKRVLGQLDGGEHANEAAAQTHQSRRSAPRGLSPLELQHNIVGG